MYKPTKERTYMIGPRGTGGGMWTADVANSLPEAKRIATEIHKSGRFKGDKIHISSFIGYVE